MNAELITKYLEKAKIVDNEIIKLMLGAEPNKIQKSIEDAGRIYFLRNKENTQCKIGWSTDPEIRYKQFNTGNPNLGKMSSFESHRSLEKQLHEKFKHLRVSGDQQEWFYFSKNKGERGYEIMQHIMSMGGSVGGKKKGRK